jgi:hypothetical protein
MCGATPLLFGRGDLPSAATHYASRPRTSRDCKSPRRPPATKAFAAPVGSFALDKITEDFVQTEATKFFARVASEIG